MIKELIGTAVKVETEQEARLVVALYELAGFEKNNGFDDYLALVLPMSNYISIIKHNIYLSAVQPKLELITIDQLAWDYGIAPDWADRVVRSKSGHSKFYFANDVKVKNINGAEYERVNCLGDWGGVLSTRPTKEPVWPEKGSLPPVGEVCEYKTSDGGFLPCKILAVHGDAVAFSKPEFKNTIFTDKASKRVFRPIKTEREKVIEFAAEKLGLDCPLPIVLEKLYDIGALRMPEDERGDDHVSRIAKG